MRADIGLPSPERNIGLAAHDFFTLANAPQVYITRSEKIDGAPATASRWLAKLDILLSKFSRADAITDEYWQGIALRLDEPEQYKEILPPEPRPPLSARPRMLSVTQVETLLRNPYAIYASQILRLHPLESIMRELNGADFGNAVHKVLEKFVKQYPAKHPADAYDKLIEYGKQILQPFLSNDRIRALWWPRFVRIARFVIEQEHERRTAAQLVSAEVKESHVFDEFTLTGRADRIEEYTDGKIVVDYKTGVLPTNAAMETGLASQLALLGLMIKEKAENIKSLEYWQLQGGADAGKIKSIGSEESSKSMQAAKEGLMTLIKKYSDPDFPYRCTPFPAYAGRYNDYAHLARVREWQE
jgi:ATP-dependent helicase/nuclease subunit B